MVRVIVSVRTCSLGEAVFVEAAAGAGEGAPSPEPAAKAVMPPRAASVQMVAMVVRMAATVARRPPRPGQPRVKVLPTHRIRRIARVPLPPMADRPTILLVEDERSIAEPFASALAREGFDAVIATTARAALELFHRHDPSLVLLDIGLPDGDGRE